MEKGGVKVLIAILVILIIVAGGVLAYKITKDKNNTETISGEENKETVVAEEEEKTVQIFSGNDRPIAVMIDNHSDAWPQAGLNQAYMVYEIIVEGGETRLRLMVDYMSSMVAFLNHIILKQVPLDIH